MGIGHLLVEEMRENFVIDSELERFSLLNDIESESIKSKGILKRNVSGQLVL
jgi:hypothetical protein